MIQIRIKHKEDVIYSIDVTGHAGYADKGEDLICASVSSIMFGLANALDEVDHLSSSTVQIGDNQIVLEMDSYNVVVATILKTGYIQLLTVQENFKKYVKIEKMEV